MRSLLLAILLLAISVKSIAVTDMPDGSVMLTKEEAKNWLTTLQKLQSDQQTARLVFARMQNRIDALEAEIKGTKCL